MQQERHKVYFKGSNTIKTLLMAPKDKDTKPQNSEVIDKCPQINCPEEYIGETGRAFGQGLKNISGPHPSSFQFHWTSK